MIVVKGSKIITEKDIGFEFFVYNGKSLVAINIVEGMENRYFGEFCVTKRLGGFIHKKRVKNKK